MATPLSGGITIDTPLMIAAKNGVVEMVERILELFPSRIKDVNAEGKNIVLLAVEYRQTEVFRFLCKQKWLSQSLFGQVDKEGNNALHLAATLGVDIDWLNPGKFNWFEFVKKSMPPGLSERYNRKMETPEDILRESHEKLLEYKPCYISLDGNRVIDCRGEVDWNQVGCIWTDRSWSLINVIEVAKNMALGWLHMLQSYGVLGVNKQSFFYMKSMITWED
ncbi:hypothetical protein K1719_018352 [Acacia pycnantha]|nr:hypothetical protein K1719_018352 [Acacia pycnantha]